jgi:hypothetical protein
MKPIHWVPPILALITAAAWLADLQSARRTLEQKNASLQRKLIGSGSTGSIRTSGAKVRTISQKARADEKNQPSADWVSTSKDWNALVMFNNNEGARFNLTAACRRLEQLASEMTGDELVTAYGEIAALPVEAEFRNYLEFVMLDQLKRKNPEFAFSQYIAKCQNGDTSPAQMTDFNQWLARDPAAATAWYETQLAGNVFDKTLDGKSPSMLPFESAFIMSSLVSDPAAAEQRMNNIPADLRGSLADYLWNVPPENAKAFVDLLRKTMTVDQYVSILRNNRLTEYNFSPGSSGDPAKIQKNLDSLGLTSEERSTLLTQHFEELAKYGARRAGWGNPSREKFDELRGWIQAVDPPSADRATGLALQMYLEQSKNAEIQNFVEKVALDYHRSGSGDELLIPIIACSANGSTSFPKERARMLAAKISDEDLREMMLQKLE